MTGPEPTGGTSRPTLGLRLLSGRLAVCRLAPGAALPAWATAGEGPWSLTRTADELSVVCAGDAVPAGVRAEHGWRCLAVDGPLDFGLVGVVAGLTGPLAAAGIPVFVVSTHDTDLLLVKEDRLTSALAALDAAGHRVRR